MAWQLGLTEGTSRGLEREQAWKTMDRNRAAAREEVQFEQLVNQINTNTERAYRAERDAVADNQWSRRQGFLEKQEDTRNKQWGDEFAFRKKAQRTRNKQWGKEYNLRKQITDHATEKHEYWRKRQPEIDAITDELTREQIEGIRKENEHLYGGETWLGKLLPDSVEKYLPRSMVRNKGYREILREKSQLDVDTHKEEAPLRKAQNEAAMALAEWQKKDLTYRMSPEGQAELKGIRELDRQYKQSQINVNNARVEALRNPQSSSTSRVKPMTRAEANRYGASVTLPNIAAKDTGGFTHNYLPYKDNPDKPSIHKIILKQGEMIGRDLRRQNPANTTSVELDQIIGGVWEGMVGQSFGDTDKKRSFDTAITDGLRHDQMTPRRNEAFNTFRDAVLRGYDNPRAGTGSWLDNEADDTPVNPPQAIDTSFWSGGRSRGTGDNSMTSAYEKTVERKIGERIRGEMGIDKDDYIFQMDAYLRMQANQYISRGSLNWDDYRSMSENQKMKLFNLLPADKQAQFKIEWESYLQDNHNPLKVR